MIAAQWTRARLRLALWIAARMMPLRVRGLPLKAVLDLAEPCDRHRYRGLTATYIATAVARATRHPWLMRNRRCLRRGLLGFRFLSEAGVEPELYFGLDPAALAAGHTVAHCWVCVDGKPVVNERPQEMMTVLVHPGGREREGKRR